MNEVFGHLVKHILDRLIYLLKTNAKKETEKQNSLKSMPIKIRYPNTITVLTFVVLT